MTDFDETRPHQFEARSRGSSLACRWCGARKEDPIHQQKKKTQKGVRAQALVEMAIVLPILLLLVTGFIVVGLVMTERMTLLHAAQEGVVSGAGQEEGQTCVVAEAVAEEVYQGTLSTNDCHVNGEYLDLTVARRLDVQLLSPIWTAPFEVRVTATAVRR